MDGRFVIRGAQVVAPWGVVDADVEVRDGRIHAVGSLDAGDAPPFDAGGLILTPGGIDPHVHFENPSWGTVTAHDFRTGTQAAALGGTTTIIDFAFPEQGESPATAVERRRGAAEGRAVVDFGLHACVFSGDDASLRSVDTAIEMGASSVKVFMAYSHAGWMLDDGAMLEVMERIAHAGGVLCVHAENDAILQHRIRRCVEQGDMAPSAHGRSRPPLVEAEAIGRVTRLASATGCRVYVVHVSSALGVEAVRAARATGWGVYAETCPHYLVLDESLLDGPQGARYVVSPPLRHLPDQQRLWAALADGTLDAVGSDDAAYFDEHKLRGAGDFRRVANGLPGAQIRMPLLFSEGVVRRRLALERFVELTAAAAARIFGLYPRKGAIAPGSDADLVLWDPRQEWTPDTAAMHTPIEYTCYESMRLTGRPVNVWSAGRLVVEGGELADIGAGGRFRARATERLALERAGHVGTPGPVR